MEKINIGIVGVKGFAKTHLQAISSCADLGDLKAAVIRVHGGKPISETQKEMEKNGITIYRDYRQMYDQEQGNIQLVALPVGTDQHKELSVRALNHGYHVICEKPVAGSIDEAHAMRSAQKETGQILAIGYQDIFSPSIQKVKALRLSGRLGRLRSAKTFALWPRSSAYYNRNDWAGKYEFNGKKILDSPMQNATSHFLNNMLYVAGDAPDESSLPSVIMGENYRAKDIESADTQCIRVITVNDVEIYFAVSHAVEQSQGPITDYIFEKGRVHWEFDGQTNVFLLKNGTEILIETFDNQGVQINNQVFRNTLEAILKGKHPLSTIHNAYQHTICIEKSFLSSNGINQIPESYSKHIKPEKEEYGDLEVDESTYSTVVPGLEDTIRRMYKDTSMFFEACVPWAKKVEKVEYSSMEREVDAQSGFGLNNLSLAHRD